MLEDIILEGVLSATTAGINYAFESQKIFESLRSIIKSRTDWVKLQDTKSTDKIYLHFI